MPLAANTAIKQYRILAPIGKGGMGEVYLAQDTALGRKVALKILPSEFADDRDRMDRFVREAQSASALNHPNIITIHEIGESNGTHFIATEFIDGKTLTELAQSQPLDYRFMLDVAIQVASALDDAHAAGIVHRDIKPDNVMVRSNGLAKLLDFGIAKLSAPAGSSDDPDGASAADPRRRDHRHAAVHVARTGSRAARRPPDRHLQPRCGDASHAVGPVAVCGRHGQRRAGGGVDQGAATTDGSPGGSRGDRQQDVAEGHSASLSLGQGLGARPQSLQTGVRFSGQSGPPRANRHVSRPTPGRPGSRPSIAVLPFTNMSADADNEYFCDGLAEELLNALSKIDDLKVAARTSAFSFKGKSVERERDWRQVGRQPHPGRQRQAFGQSVANFGPARQRVGRLSSLVKQI